MASPTYFGDIKTKSSYKGYKASRFNAKSEDRQGNLILYNTYTNHFVKIPKEYKMTVNSILRNPDFACYESKLFEFLLNRGFLVSKSADEFRKAEMRHHETITSEGTLSLTLMPNEDCNFRCKYCYESFVKKFMKNSVQEGIINYIKKNIRKYTEVHIDWFGGEPLTAVPIIEKISKEIINVCANNRVRYSAGITTNGYNLTLDVFRKMQACRIRSFQITLDGLADSHDQLRVRADGEGTFERIVSNLKAIRDEIKSNSFKIAVRTNVTTPVYKNIDHFYDFFKFEFGEDDRFYSHLHLTGNWGGDSVQNIQNSFCTSKEIINALHQGIEKGVKVSPLYDEQLADSVCYAAKRNNFIIGSDGMIYKCTVAFDDEFNQIGYLDENGQMYIDEDKYSMWVSGHESVDKGCQNCFFRPSCQGASCPYVRIHTNQSSCPTVKSHIKEYLRIVASQSQRLEHLQEEICFDHKE